MNKYAYANIIFDFIWTSVIVYLLIMEENSMSFTESVLVATIPTVVGIAGTYFATSRSNVNKNTNVVRKLTEKLGISKSQTLTKSIEDKFNSIHNDIGRGEGSTLTKQHKAIEKKLNKEIQLIEQRYDEEKNQLADFNSEQHDIAETIKDFRLFMESWLKATAENNDLKVHITELNHKVELLNNKINSLEQENYHLKLQSQHHSFDDRQI